MGRWHYAQGYRDPVIPGDVCVNICSIKQLQIGIFTKFEKTCQRGGLERPGALMLENCFPWKQTDGNLQLESSPPRPCPSPTFPLTRLSFGLPGLCFLIQLCRTGLTVAVTRKLAWAVCAATMPGRFGYVLSFNYWWKSGCEFSVWAPFLKGSRCRKQSGQAVVTSGRGMEKGKCKSACDSCEVIVSVFLESTQIDTEWVNKIPDFLEIIHWVCLQVWWARRVLCIRNNWMTWRKLVVFTGWVKSVALLEGAGNVISALLVSGKQYPSHIPVFFRRTDFYLGRRHALWILECMSHCHLCHYIPEAGAVIPLLLWWSDSSAIEQISLF